MRMEDGSIFLQEVTEKIKERIAQTERRLRRDKKKSRICTTITGKIIRRWIEYGYESMTTSRHSLPAGKRQPRAARLKAAAADSAMLDAPFFGRVDFQYDGDDDAEIFYIGIGNFAEKTGSVPLIYDWRAPVSSLFYDYDGGPAS